MSNNNNYKRLLLGIAKVQRSFNYRALFRTIINVFLVGLSLAVAAILIRKIVGGYDLLYLLFFIPFFAYLGIAIAELRRRWISLSKATTYIDRRLNLKARLVTAMECIKEPNPSKFSSALVEDVINKLNDKNIQKALPSRVPKSLAAVIPLAILLALLLLLMPNLRQENPFLAYRESPPQWIFSTPWFDQLAEEKGQTASNAQASKTEKQQEESKKEEANQPKAGKEQQPQNAKEKENKSTPEPLSRLAEKEQERKQQQKQEETQKNIEKKMNSIQSLLAKLMPPMLRPPTPPMPQPPMLQPPSMSGSGQGGSGSDGGNASNSGQSGSEQKSSSSGSGKDSSQPSSGEKGSSTSSAASTSGGSA
ncbi:MAG TPA: hypothetical protein ACFYD3_03605, partial [Candidatus Hypogeohydataceae bacterium YC41]